jgi:hypothetical protein
MRTIVAWSSGVIAVAAMMLAGFLWAYQQLVFENYRSRIDEMIGSAESFDASARAYHPCIVIQFAPRLITQVVDDPARERAATPAPSDGRVTTTSIDFDKESVPGWHLRATIWTWLLRAEYSETELLHLHRKLTQHDGAALVEAEDDCRKQPWHARLKNY